MHPFGPKRVNESSKNKMNTFTTFLLILKSEQVLSINFCKECGYSKILLLHYFT